MSWKPTLPKAETLLAWAPVLAAKVLAVMLRCEL